LSAACTGLAADQIPSVIRYAPGPDFARDCTMLVVWPVSLSEERISGGTASDDVQPVRQRAATMTVPVWEWGVAYVRNCLPLADNYGNPPDTATYNAAVDEFVTIAASLWLAFQAAARQNTLLPSLFGLDIPPPLRDFTECSGLEISPLTFTGPTGDQASAEWGFSFQWQ
jgi:hypothetical protein